MAEPLQTTHPSKDLGTIGLQKAEAKFRALAEQAEKVRARIVESGSDEAHKLGAEVETGRGVAYAFAADYLKELREEIGPDYLQVLEERAHERETEEAERGDKAEADRDSLRLQIDGLRKALSRYGRHTPLCGSQLREDTCDCGLREALVLTTPGVAEGLGEADRIIRELGDEATTRLQDSDAQLDRLRSGIRSEVERLRAIAKYHFGSSDRAPLGSLAAAEYSARGVELRDHADRLEALLGEGRES